MLRDNEVWELSTGFVKGIIRDQNGSGLQPATLKYSLYVRDTKAVINSKINITLTPVSTYIDATGVILPAFVIATTDNVIASQGVDQEEHVVRIEWTWPGGSGADEITFTVRKLPTVT